MAGPRIVLVDDHALCRTGLSDLLSHRGGMEVLAALSDPDEVLAVLRERKPDLVVLDLREASVAETEAGTLGVAGLTVLNSAAPGTHTH